MQHCAVVTGKGWGAIARWPGKVEMEPYCVRVRRGKGLYSHFGHVLTSGVKCIRVKQIYL